MAMRALHTGRQLIQKQLTLANRSGRVTPNTTQLLIRSEASSGGLQQIGGSCAVVADRDIHTGQLAEVGQVPR